MRRWLVIAASVVVSGAFLWLALRGVPLADVLDGIRQTDLAWLVLSLVTALGSLASRAVRWRGLLDGRVSLIQSFHILNVTMLLNQLPLRAGEVARTLLATRSGIPLVTAATSIVVERLLDVVAVILMLAAALSQLPEAPPLIVQAATLFGAAALVAFIVMIVFARYPQRVDALLGRLELGLPVLRRFNLRRRVDEVLDGLAPLTHGRRAAHAILWTAIGWTSSTLTFYTLERALGITGANLVLGAVIAVTLASFSIAIPVSVASIGPFEGAVRVAGDVAGMSPLVATTLGFLIHGVTVLSYAVFGVIGLLALGVSLGDVLAQPKKAQPDG
jgi:uncharacterized protein (TIRG00374 family)